MDNKNSKNCNMKCPQCIAENKRSCVYQGMSTTTLMEIAQYWDEDGNYVYHDPNITTTQYSCSNGHKWNEKKGG